MRAAWLDGLAATSPGCAQRGQQVVIVTSGAIALGRPRLGLPQRPLRLEEKQAAAATGQILLARAWQESLARHGLETAQILITLEDTEARRRYLNARATIDTLLRLGVVPVVNENDTVATTEIRFGDNDRLSARVAVMAWPRRWSCSPTSTASTPPTRAATRPPGTCRWSRRSRPRSRPWPAAPAAAVGTGGMVSKLIAARIATPSGCAVVLAHGQSSSRSPASRPAPAAPCSPPHHPPPGAQGLDRRQPRRRRQPGHRRRARRRAEARARLLPAGVRRSRAFERGDAVLVRAPAPARASPRAWPPTTPPTPRRIVGRRTDEIEAILGYRGRDEMVHRDDLVLL